MSQGTYLCFECRHPVYKTEGLQYRHHFRHWASNGEDFENCSATGESVEHKAAKQRLGELLERNRLVRIPLTIGCGGWTRGTYRVPCTRLADVDFELPDYDEVMLEFSMLAGLRPDVLLSWNGAPVMALEVFFTHEVSTEKARAYLELGLPWLEVTAGSVLNPKTERFRHHGSSQVVEGTCSSCREQLAEELKRREVQARAREYVARKVRYAKDGDRPVLPKWAQDGESYSCPVCEEAVTFHKSEGVFLHRTPTSCSDEAAHATVAALALRRLLVRGERLTYQVRCSGSLFRDGRHFRCNQVATRLHDVPAYDVLGGSAEGVTAYRNNEPVWRAVFSRSTFTPRVPTIVFHASSVFSADFRLPAPVGEQWWCRSCTENSAASSSRQGLGMYGSMPDNERHVEQYRHNHRLAAQLLIELRINLRRLRRQSLALAPCTTDGCRHDVVLVLTRNRSDLPGELLRLVRVTHQHRWDKGTIEPLCPHCGEAQLPNAQSFLLDTSALVHFHQYGE